MMKNETYDGVPANDFNLIADRYTLIAINESGASVEFKGATKMWVKCQFDAEYERDGFKIRILDSVDGAETILKSTFR